MPLNVVTAMLCFDCKWETIVRQILYSGTSDQGVCFGVNSFMF